MAEEVHVTLSGGLRGRYVLERKLAGGRVVLAPETSAEAILARLGHEPATLAEFEAEHGPVRPPDREGWAIALKKGYTRVAFDDLAWEEDLRTARGSAPRIAKETRARLEREGQEVDALFACDTEGRDGTSLPDCVKVYLPPPGGPLGLVYRIAKDEKGRLYLDHLAFGVRHVPPGSKAESVYEVAHRRLHRED